MGLSATAASATASATAVKHAPAGKANTWGQREGDEDEGDLIFRSGSASVYRSDGGQGDDGED